jgi:quercetin dioxygenase-like cupin family protein
VFYILDGSVQVLSGEDVVSAEAGDVIVVPPQLPHASAAQPGSNAENLIVIAPGVEPPYV